MSPPKNSRNGPLFWRSIRQNPAALPDTPAARRRRLLRIVRITVLVLLAVIVPAGIFWSIHSLRGPSGKANLSRISPPLAKVDFLTDGVLTESWLKTAVKFPSGASLMDIDIFDVRRQLESCGQVRSATVEREFPSALRIRLREHQPVFRIAAGDAQNQRKILFVSADGTLYHGYGYPRHLAASLPWLTGVRLRSRPNGGFEPLPGVAELVPLLEKARQNHPELYAQWREIDCNHFDPAHSGDWSTFRVRTRSTGEIIFSTKDFDTQLLRLNHILRNARQDRLHLVRRIDLSLGDHAAVQVDGQWATAASRP